jgi:hypothetical protein
LIIPFKSGKAVLSKRGLPEFDTSTKLSLDFKEGALNPDIENFDRISDTGW